MIKDRSEAARKLYEIQLAVEALGASEELTHVSVLLGELDALLPDETKRNG